MSEAKPRSYWSVLHKDAMEASKDHFRWGPSILAAAVVYVFTAAIRGPGPALDDLNTTVIAGLAAVVVGLGVYFVNLIRASERMYRQQEVKKEVYRQSIDGLLNDIAQLRVALEDKRKNQAFANVLTERYVMLTPGDVVVAEEGAKTSRRNAIKIPKLCKQFDVECITLATLMRDRLKADFSRI